MPRSCYVEGCPGDYGWGSKAWKKPTPLSFYRVPSIISEKNRKFRGQEDRLKKVIELSKVRRKAWLKILKREHVPDCQIIQICARHFITGRPADLEDNDNPDWVPSVDVGNETSPVESSVENPETEEEISNDDSSQKEINEFIPNDESSPEDASNALTALNAENPTEISNESSSPKQARILPAEKPDGNSDFEEVEMYSELETGDEGPGHFHIQFCTKKACLLSKSGANMYTIKPTSNDSEN